VKEVDWKRVSEELDAQGSAVIEGLLQRPQCDALTALYEHEAAFRKRIVMARHGYGRGEYKYFNYPLPDLVTELRTSLYPQLQPIANAWNELMPGTTSKSTFSFSRTAICSWMAL